MLECNNCRKELKTKNTLKNHDKKCHIIIWQFISGSVLYKCYNCNKKLTEKNCIGATHSKHLTISYFKRKENVNRTSEVEEENIVQK